MTIPHALPLPQDVIDVLEAHRGKWLEIGGYLRISEDGHVQWLQPMLSAPTTSEP